ncbi:MAG TPA: PAS domain-containing protein [Pseudolabrys sp.]|nr:PAS domain-containing protein [Pseudolabrys sp.]
MAARTLLLMQRRGSKRTRPVPIRDRRETPASRDETGFVMKSASTRALFEYWDRQRAGRLAPKRSDIDPGDIRQVLGDTFMLSADFSEDIRFRLAGTRVCALFGRELKGESFEALWSDASGVQLAGVTTAAIHETTGTVAGVIGRTAAYDEVELEMLLLPIASDGQTRTRVLGGLAAQVAPYWLNAQPLAELELRSMRYIGIGKSTVTRGAGFGLQKRGGRVLPRFRVYPGGCGPGPAGDAG